MPPKRRRRFQGLYYHSSPPKVLPMNGQASNHGRRRRDVDDFSVKLSTIRIWMHEKDIGKLTRILWAGQGSRLCQQASTNPRVKRFLSAVPYVMNSIKDVHQAVIDNNLETLQAKMEPPVPPALITCRDANGLNLIHKASGLGHTKILEYLISTWPDGVSETDITGKTPLHWAASHKNNMRCYTLLTEAGCDEEAMDYKMKTPTYYRHKPNEIERAFLVYVPEAPRVSPNIATDWEALSEEVGDGAKKLEIKVPDTNGRTTNDSIENTSEVDLNDGISATEEEHAATPIVNGNGRDKVTEESAGNANATNNEGTNRNDVKKNAEEHEDVSQHAVNDIKGEPEVEEIEPEVEAAGAQTNMKTLNETTTTTSKTGSDEPAEQTESETGAEEEKSNEAEEIQQVDEQEMSEKEKEEVAVTTDMDLEKGSLSNEKGENGNEKLTSDSKEEVADNKEDDEVGEVNIKLEKENKEKETGEATELITTEEVKLGQNVQEEMSNKEDEDKNKESEDEEAQDEKGIVGKLKEGAQDLAASMRKAIGIEKNVTVDDENKLVEKISNELEMVKELEEKVTTDNEMHQAKNGIREMEEIVSGKNDKLDGNEKVYILDELKKDTKQNENESIKNKDDKKNEIVEEADKIDKGNKIEKENGKEEKENEKERTENENNVTKTDAKDKKLGNNNETAKKENEDMSMNEEKTYFNEENTAETNGGAENKENSKQEIETQNSKENGNSNDNDSKNTPDSQKQQSNDRTNSEKVKGNTEELKKEAIKENDKTEEDVNNEINQQLDKTIDNAITKSEADGKIIPEDGVVGTKNELQKEEQGKSASAEKLVTANGAKIPRLATAKATRYKRNGSSKRNGSGKINSGTLVEDENDDDDDDDEDEDDEVQFGMLY